MKRLVVILLAIGFCVLSFAKGDKKEKPQLSPEETIKASIESLQGTLSCLKDFMNELEKLRDDTSSYQTEIRNLKAEKKQVESMLTTKANCKMLIGYPLSIPYDSALVAQSLSIIKQYNVDKVKENQQYCNLRLPFLEEYGAYSTEIYKILADILDIYFEDGKPRKYDKDMFQHDIEKTSYYKKSEKTQYKIKYLDEVINRVQEVAQEGKLSKEFLEEILEEMKK